MLIIIVSVWNFCFLYVGWNVNWKLPVSSENQFDSIVVTKCTLFSGTSHDQLSLVMFIHNHTPRKNHHNDSMAGRWVTASCIQLFRQRLSKKSVKAYPTMLKGSAGNTQ